MGQVRIGISGWRYEPWRGIFYPKELAQRRELEFAARAFSSIELNGSFYSLQHPRSYAAWHNETPDDFIFSVKGPRYITHIRKLNQVEIPLANFFASGLFNLKEKLGPLLWQFPPSLRYDEQRFDRFFALLPRDTAEALSLARRRDSRMNGRARLAIDSNRPLRHAIEIRHNSFACESFIALLRRHGIALVVADTAGKFPYLEDVTTDFMYLRLHGDKQIYASGYTDAALDRWQQRIRQWMRGAQPRDAIVASNLKSAPRKSRDVYAYFDNDVKVRAPFDAERLMQMLGLERLDASFVFPDRRHLKGFKASPLLPDQRWLSRPQRAARQARAINRPAANSANRR
jgi:uncharacterized protein YecE (DUF72 family)